MAQEEHTQKCSNSSSGGGGSGSGGGGGCSGDGGGNRSSKKLKQKKVPQRGLGVAQLEKIRLEEQQKKDAVAIQAANILSPNSIVSPSNSSSCLAVQCPNFRPNLSPSSIPLPPPSPTDLPSPNSIFRPSPSIPNIDVLCPNSISLSKPLNVSGNDIGWSAILGPGHGHWPKLWNSEYNLEGENQRLDPHGIAFRSNVNFPFESNSPIWPLPSVIHRSQQYQQPPSSMVNVSSGTSSSPSINFQMEPPSNQSHCGSNYTALWPEEEKMVGMKRPCPFSLDNLPGPSFQCKYPNAYVAPISRSDESTSCGNGGTASIEPGNPVFREGPSSSSGMYEPNPKKAVKENGGLNGDFLTLAPPATASLQLSSKHKHSSALPGPHNGEKPEFELLPYQGCSEDTIHRPVPSGLIQQPFFSFFPSAKAQIGQAATTVSNCNCEVGENIDLNLKL